MSQIQEAYQTLAEIDRLLAHIELQINNITSPKTTRQLEGNIASLREIERLALRWLIIARQMGLPEEVEGAINKLSRLIVTLRMVQISMSMLLSTNPVTMGIGIAGLIGASMSAGDILAGY